MQKLISIMFAGLLFAAGTNSATAQNICSKQIGEQMKIYIRNATDKAITVN